jgi:hypothetical protein
VTTTAERLKVHRRSLRLGELEYTILSPRPNVGVRFATNRFHDMWHVVSDIAGARLLARLFWAMAFQQRPRTIVLIDKPLLIPNPFDGDPSAPIIIGNNDLGPLGREIVNALRAKLPLGMPSMGTVILQTRGLDAALHDQDAFRRRDDQASWRDQHRQRRWIDGSDGPLVMAAPPPVLRQWGVELSNLGQPLHHGLDWSYLDYPEKSGEVHVIDDLTTQVETAVALRRRLFPEKGEVPLTLEERIRVWTLRREDP